MINQSINMVKNEEDLNCWTTYDAADKQWTLSAIPEIMVL